MEHRYGVRYLSAIDVYVLAEDAFLADASSFHDVGKVPDFGPGAHAGTLIEVSRFVNEISGGRRRLFGLPRIGNRPAA